MRIPHPLVVPDMYGYNVPYRYNPDLYRWEFWNHISGLWTHAVLGLQSSHPVLSYDDTWTEPTSEL